MADVTLEAYRSAYRELISEKERRGWKVHAAVYVIVNAGLVALNVFISPGTWWFPYTLVGWGIGLAFHYMGAYQWLDRDLAEKEALAMDRARGGD